jgi:hypothetical protein
VDGAARDPACRTERDSRGDCSILSSLQPRHGPLAGERTLDSLGVALLGVAGSQVGGCVAGGWRPAAAHRRHTTPRRQLASLTFLRSLKRYTRQAACLPLCLQAAAVATVAAPPGGALDEGELLALAIIFASPSGGQRIRRPAQTTFERQFRNATVPPTDAAQVLLGALVHQRGGSGARSAM